MALPAMRPHGMMALLALAAFAGCSDDAPSEAVVDDLGLEATETTGVIRGVVIDDAISPVAGVTITAQGPGGEAPATESTEEGAFGFDGLAPGTWFLEASKPGFGRIQQSVDVVADVETPPLVKIQMIRDPALTPFVEAVSWTGFIECSLRAGTGPANQGSVGLNACDGVGNQYSGFPLGGFSGLPDLLQAELVWESTQTLGSGLSFVVGPPTCEDIKYGRADGASPLVIPLAQADLTGNNVSEADGVCYRVFSFTAEETAHFAGLILSQEFGAYFHGFHNFLPPEGWQFSKDGDPVVPT